MPEEGQFAQNLNQPPITPQPIGPKSGNLTKHIFLGLLGLALTSGVAYAGYWYGIKSAKPESTEVTVPVSRPSPNLTPTSVPLETRQEGIAYVRNSDEIWVMDFDGENKSPTGVTLIGSERETIKGFPIIRQSPDWHWIAFVDNRDGSGFELWIVDVNGENLRKISNEAYPEEKEYYGGLVDSHVTWSPDSEKIYYFAQTYTTEIEGQVYKEKLTKEDKKGLAGGYIYNIETNDKTKLPPDFGIKVFWGNKSQYMYSGQRFTEGFRDKVKKYDTSSERVVASYAVGFYEQNFEMSPDGTKIVSFNSRPNNIRNSYVQYRDSNFGNPTNITEMYWTGYPSPKISPDGKRVAYPSEDGIVWIYDLETTRGYRMDNVRVGGKYSTHKWMNNNEILYWYGSNWSTYQGDLFKVNVDTREVDQLTKTGDVYWQ